MRYYIGPSADETPMPDLHATGAQKYLGHPIYGASIYRLYIILVLPMMIARDIIILIVTLR